MPFDHLPAVPLTPLSASNYLEFDLFSYKIGFVFFFLVPCVSEIVQYLSFSV